MAALTEDRMVVRVGTELFPTKMRRLLKGGVKAIKGGFAANQAGYARPGITALNLLVFGVFTETVDNTAGADGAASVGIERGVFAFNNSSAGDLITQADVGASCYIVDDQTVAKTNGTNTRSVAGVIEGFDGTMVLVRVGG